MIIIGNGRLITRDSEQPYLENGAVVTENELIKEVGSLDALRKKYPEAEFVDAKGGVIMPAFINAHTHIYSALARGFRCPAIIPQTSLRCWTACGGGWTGTLALRIREEAPTPP